MTVHYIAPGQWQPIETAPKDGTRVLLFEDGEIHLSHYRVHESYTNGQLMARMESWVYPGAFRVGLGDDKYPNPSHWMPLPPTPDRSGEADKTGTGLAEGESGLPEGSSKP